MAEEEKKELKISFAPGCFDDFDGTQEELDEMIAEITKIFTENTPEEVMAMSVPVDDFEELDEEYDEIFSEIKSNITNERKLH